MDINTLQTVLEHQRRAHQHDGSPDAATRIERLDRLAAMVLTHADAIVTSLSSDFGTRSAHATRVGDVLGAVAAIRYNRDHVRQWMEPQAVALPPAIEQTGARAQVCYQPLGVIGAIVPWNGPVLMGVLAAAGAFAAGNRLMLKVPELTPRASALLADMFAHHFASEEAAVVQGDANAAAAFSHLRFDHLIFTGSTAVARRVAVAAAQNLVPVTLELGGRNPVIVGRSADLELTAARLATGKMASAGQVCVAPDYVLVPRARLPELLERLAAHAAKLYPHLLDNDDATAIASDAHFARLRALLEDARAQGAKVIEVNPAQEPLWDSPQRKFPLCLLTEVTAQMRIAQEESFGPLLSLIPYDRLSQALDGIAAEPLPLSAYYFGTDAEEEQYVVTRVAAGNMVVNDVRCQLFFEALPFGGVGVSGYGRYRGYAGFQTFSNAKTVLYQTRDDAILAAQRPPFGVGARVAVQAQIQTQIQALGTAR